MFVGIIGKGKSARVWLQESYREGGKVKKRLIQCYGYLSELTKDDPQAFEKLKAQFEESRAEKKALKQAREFAAAQEILNGETSLDDFCTSLRPPEMIFSNYIIRHLWSELGLNVCFDSMQRRRYKTVEFNINEVAFVESFLKIIDPSSIRHAYTHRGDLLGAPLYGVSLDQMYSVLDVFYDNKDVIINNINRNLDKQLNRSKTMIFYDVTNAYIESPLTDEEKKYYRDIDKNELKDILDSAVSDSLMSKEDVEQFLNNEFDLDLLPESIRQEVRCMLFLRMRGKSKEHRTDLPIISIALVIDEKSIPIDFEIFSGCASEIKTMRKSISNFQRKYNIKQTIVVADRGINSTENTKKMLDEGYGFIVAQKVSNLQSAERKSMFDEEGYQEYYILKDNNSPLDKDNIHDVVRYKCIDFTKKDRNNNTVECKLVFTHSKKREERDLSILELNTKKAKDAIDKNIDIPNSNQGWVNLIEKSKDKKIKAEKLNEKLIEERKKLAGYAGFIYHDIPGKEQNLTVRDILSSYHQLVEIEDCFRIMKDSLGLRPMYVWTEEHIQGHVMCCYLALVMLRLLQIKLVDFGHPMTINDIVMALKNAKLTALCRKDNNDLFITSSNYCQIFKNYENFSDEKLEEIIQSRKFHYDIDAIMYCLKLNELPVFANRTTLMRALRAKPRLDQPLIDPVVRRLATGQLQTSPADSDAP